MYVKKNIREIKQDLRRRYRTYREALEPAQKVEMDAAVRRRLFRLPIYRNNRVIFIYVSKPIEVDTIGIIQHALAHGKRVAVPRCTPGTYQMQFYFIRSLADLEPGMFGVLEPSAEHCQPVADLRHGLCVVPGLSFDAQGYRLGYGKGYYDRFLSSFGGQTAGICYRACVPWNLPHGYYDRPVDILITETYIRKTGSRPASRQEERHD